MSKKIAERLIELRGKTSQAEIARIAGVKSATTISNWENWDGDEHSSPSAEAIARLAKHWDVTADYLVGISDSPNPLPTNAWIVDLDYIDAIRRGDRSVLRPGEFGAVPVPRRCQVMSSAEYHILRAEIAPLIEALQRRGKR